MKEDELMIAKFMGLPCELVDGPLTSESYVYVRHTENSNWQITNYKTSWDWLMPVIGKIESLQFEVEISSQMETVDDDRSIVWHQDTHIGDGLRQFAKGNGKTKIESVYNAVVEFIKWYNQTTHQ